MKLISATKAPLFLATYVAIEIKVIKLKCCKTVVHFCLLLHLLYLGYKLSLSLMALFVKAFGDFYWDFFMIYSKDPNLYQVQIYLYLTILQNCDIIKIY
jgi:hypothetical protein